MEAPRKEEKLRELDKWIKSNPDSRELKRVLAVKLAGQGASYKAIASLLNVSKSFISKWKKRYHQKGIEGLKLAYKGSKSYLSQSEKKATIDWIKAQEYWDLSELECYLIEEYDVVFKSVSSYYELLNEAKISWQKAQKKNPRRDPELAQKRNEEIKSKIEEFLEKIKAGKVVVYAIDEVHLLEGDLISHGWGDCKNRLKIPLNNEKNRQTYYGALNVFAPDLIVREYPAGNGENTANFVKELIKINQEEAKKNNPEEERQILIIWDGATYHKGPEMRELLGCINQNLTEEEWKVICELFAPNAPEENPIEAVWLQLKNLLRRCYRFCKNFNIIKRLFKLLIDLKLFNFPDFKKYAAFSCLI